MNNYPAGVTGREPQIAGYPEGVMDAVCSNMLDAEKVSFTVEGVEGSFPLSATQDEIECPFKGKLDVQYVGEEAVGPCPICGNDIYVALPDMGADY